MGIIDFLIIGLLLRAAWGGYRQGLWMGVAGLCAMLLGVWLGLVLADKLFGVSFGLSLSDSMQAWLDGYAADIGDRLLLLVCIVLMVILLIYLFSRFVKTMLYLTPLGWVDKCFGAVCAVLIWGALIGIALVVWGGILGVEHTVMGALLRSLGAWVLGWLQGVGSYA